MSVNVAGFKSGPVFDQIKAGVETLPEAQKKQILKQANGVFEIVIKNAEGKEQAWTLELKKEGKVTVGKSETKPDITINTSDETFLDLASGKLNGQKAFMSGKLKIKGNMMLATKLDVVLKAAKSAPVASAGSAAAAVAAPGAPSPAPTPAPVPAAAPASSGSVEVPGFQSSAIFSQIKAGLGAASKEQKEATAKKAKAVFQFDVKGDGKVQTWTLDLKDDVSVTTGAPAKKPDIVITISDKDFVDLASGKLNGQKAFMGGKLKIKGNMMLATKLDAILKELKPQAKL
ncbi:SCP2 sterol-binding domain-containing protein [Fimicolochytrium jonesii]|uniref:SCP2 sterol-binding domain-containing protein n=1 Tax=Fimicolochytrium jonesii TaxID=1396493 RepID=UPI0022FE5EC3|nr:SCP2 sterol-binding domain-containing protein [Fimicolochytrium jonesii]KAI8824964.1 SCP2 sterol-binding domain-containing protein [Fimicolochytrium jonesii]